jgi:putative ABC transport system permease protein
LIYRLVWENLKHRPVRTFLSAIFIGISVTLILTIVGLSKGVLDDIKERARGTGADIVIRPPNSAVLGFTGNMKAGEKIAEKVRQRPHVAIATGVLIQQPTIGQSIQGINLDEFSAMSGGFTYLEGGPFQGPDDMMVDENFAESKNLHAGSTLDLGNGHMWHICAVVVPGKLSQLFVELKTLQEMYSATGDVSVIYVKVDQPANIPGVVADLNNSLDDYKILTMEQLISAMSIDNVALIKGFIDVVIGIAVIVGFLVVLLTMYTAVLERTREIGILKALGASPGYILGVLMRESILLSVCGSFAGIVMTFGTKWLVHKFAPPFLSQAIVYDWWLKAAGISLVGAALGAIYPGLKAARQDAIEALSYD